MEIEKRILAQQFMEALPHAQALGISFKSVGVGTAEMHLKYNKKDPGDLPKSLKNRNE